MNCLDEVSFLFFGSLLKYFVFKNFEVIFNVIKSNFHSNTNTKKVTQRNDLLIHVKNDIFFFMMKIDFLGTLPDYLEKLEELKKQKEDWIRIACNLFVIFNLKIL